MPCDTERKSLGYNDCSRCGCLALRGESWKVRDSSLQAVMEGLGETVCCQDLVYILFIWEVLLSAIQSDGCV